MTSKRGVRSDAMVVFLQVAIVNGNERNPKGMHDDVRWPRPEDTPFIMSMSSASNVERSPTDLLNAWKLG